MSWTVSGWLVAFGALHGSNWESLQRCCAGVKPVIHGRLREALGRIEGIPCDHCTLGRRGTCFRTIARQALAGPGGEE